MTPNRRPFLVSLLALAALFGPIGLAGATTLPVWTDVDSALLDPAVSTRATFPEAYRTVALDLGALQGLLAQAPLEFTGGNPVTVPIALPDGTTGTFLVEESPIMEPLLAARYPLIKTFRGQGLDDPAATMRFGLTAAGFHAIVLSPAGTAYIDPFTRGDIVHYISYFKRDQPRDPSLVWECDFHAEDQPTSSSRTDGAAGESLAGASAPLVGNTLGDSTLRSYRLAQAANFEYTLFHSTDLLPSKADAINFGIIPTINRVNGIYERDLSAHLVLINDLELIVWDTPADPYTNESGTNMLVENQVTIDTLIGPENYDIGHVFSTGGGGVAFLGSLCDDAVPSLKAGGVTGLPAPTGDVFSVDFVAHEIGHQFGGNHTFNGSTGNCSGGNRNPTTAYEVGSGTTIQAYAGICSPQNVQSNSDDYFHLISYIEMRNHMNSAADACAAKTATGNTPPDVEAGPDFVIPRSTPFTLTAVGNDSDGDILTYAWEQFDLGPAGDGNTDNGSSPIFRSFPPTTDPSRTFPQLSDVLANTSSTYANTTYGEILPTTDRTLNFRVSGRDNQPGQGELTWDAMQVQVVSSAGPFTVTQPDGGEVWTGTTVETVVWDVASTNLAPISAANVNIYLSTDGGLTFPILLAANVTNSGSASVGVPNLATTDARIKVQGAGNVFFDISNAVFEIQLGSGGTPFAADDSAQTTFDTGVLIDVLANDSDPNGDALSIVAVQSPTDQGGTAVETGGQIQYTPVAGFSGIDTFTYTITDGAETAVGSVSVTVESLPGCENQPADLDASFLDFVPLTGDSDPFIDNCENADLSFSVANTGGPDLTNVSIVDIRSISHPDVQIHTALPAAVAPSIASSCGATSPATGSFNFTASGLSRGDTVLFEVDLTSDELAPFTRTFTFELVDAENDVSITDVTFDFEADDNGWQVTQGSFLRLAPGAEATLFSMQSSAGVDDACDLVRSPVIRVSAATSLSLSSQFEIEPTDLGFYDRANVGLFDPAANGRSVIVPDGGANPYNVPDGASSGGCATGEAGWAGTAAPFANSTWSPSALGLSGLGPAGREVQFDVKNATDSLLSLGGIQFDQVVITNVLELVPDAQPDDLCQVSELVATDDSATTPEDTPVTIDVLANDSDPNAQFLVVQSVTQGTSGSVVNNGSDVTYTPNANFNGSDSFSYDVCNDSGDCATAVVTVTVTPVNDAPGASNDAYSTDEDTVLSVPAPGVLGNDGDVDGDALSAALVSDVSNGSLVLAGDGSFTYTPNPGFHGNDSFSYKACDSGDPVLCDTATVTITVASVNDAPAANDDSASTVEDTAVTVPVLANDSDPDGDSLMVASVEQGTNGSVTTNGSSVTYTPNAGFSGTDSFTYEACDNGDPALCDAATVTVTVDPLVEPCSGDDDDFDDDGKRDDVDSDDDNDGKSDDVDSDDDNDGRSDDDDSDDDNDCIDDEFDSRSTMENQSRGSGTAGANSSTTYSTWVGDAVTYLVEMVETEAGENLSIELYDPSGTLIAASTEVLGRAVVTTIPVISGEYVVRVVNPTALPVSYTRTSIAREPW